MSVDVLTTVVGETCWYVSAGGVSWPTFQLAFGSKVPRSKALSNPAHRDDYRLFRGEFGIFVQCPWRLIRSEQLLASSTQDQDDGSLQLLEGGSVTQAKVVMPLRDLIITFDSGIRLEVLIMNVSPDGMDNWEYWSPGGEICVAAGGI